MVNTQARLKHNVAVGSGAAEEGGLKRYARAAGKEVLAKLYELPYALMGVPGQAALMIKKIYSDHPDADMSGAVVAGTGYALSAATEIPFLHKVISGLADLGDAGYRKAEALRREAEEIRGRPTAEERFYSWVGNQPVIQNVGKWVNQTLTPEQVREKGDAFGKAAREGELEKQIYTSVDNYISTRLGKGGAEQAKN